MGRALCAIQATEQVKHCHPEEKTGHRDRRMRFRDLEENVDLDKEEGKKALSRPFLLVRAKERMIRAILHK